jgi:serine/threonine-protein kinase
MRDLIRRILGGYQSLNLEGQDEGYVLFSGQDPDTKQSVQIKVLPRLLDDNPQIAARFNTLAEAIRQLNHPNIVAAEKVGEEAGLPYVVSEAIQKAQPLTSQMNQPWAVDTAADVVMQVGQGLEHAYETGLIHGALTPDKIMIEDDGHVAVTDMGLTEIQKLVGVHITEGASPYLAPERVAGKASDASADVYSLGAIFYSLLTKQKPQMVGDQIVPPSQLNPDVSAKMDKVVVKALAQNPADRYPDVKTFLTALGASTLVPASEKAEPITSGDRCPRCGAENQTGRFCRKCGARMQQAAPAKQAQAELRVPPAESILDEPIQVTKVEVSRADVGEGVEVKMEVGHGVEVRETVIAKPRSVATGEILADFPEPLEMPQVGTPDLWPTLDEQPPLAMPEPPSMPDIDWADIAPEMPEVPTIEDIPSSGEAD